MSGYLQYSNYGDENENQKGATQSTPKPGATKPTQQKRILRTNHRTLRSKGQQPVFQQQPQPVFQQQQQPVFQQQQQPQPQPHTYVQELIKNIHSYEEGNGSDSEDDDSDNNYVPLAPSSSDSMQRQFQTEPVPNRSRFAGANGSELNAKWNPAPAKEAFSSGSASASGSLAKSNQPYIQSVFQASDDLTAAGASKDILLEKLDHIISLLETQHDEKTGHVTEELVLYCFLGVFIIFIVDSFARAGKYVR